MTKVTAIHSIHTEIDIAAPPETVWAILTDGASFPDWNPFITQMSGDLKVGKQLSITVQPAGSRAMSFTPPVLVADANTELRWLGKLGIRGIFDGEHAFTLTPTSHGTTRLIHTEVFSDLLARPLLAMMRRGTQDGFNAMNAALKARAEAA